MQFGLFAVLVLILMDIADSRKVVKGRRHRRRSTEKLSCGRGCEICSEFNGCIKCASKHFILFIRSDIRQTGSCLVSCPKGYYDDRNPDMNKCTKCKPNNCETCFSNSFCAKCNDGFYKHKGVCYSTCPEKFIAINGTMECSSVQCEMSEWGPWGPASRPGKPRGKKKRIEERTRKVLNAPPGEVSFCPHTVEKRKCPVQGLCPKDNKETMTSVPGKVKKNKNKDKGGKKKKKNQQRGTSIPITPSIPAK